MDRRRKVGAGVGVLGLAQGFAGLAVAFLDPTPNKSLAWWFLIGTVVCVVLALALWLRPGKEEPPTSAVQSGSEDVQTQNTSSTAIASGDHAVAQQGVGNTINIYGERAVRESDNRIVVKTSPEHLTGLFENNTILQANRILDDFRGKWLRVAGNVLDVYTDGGSDLTVQLQRELHEPGVVLGFNDPEAIEHAKVLARGQAITVLGQIQSATANWVSLENCEIE